ncbi:BC1881 family protein [Caloranaerobacter sp. DY30410]|uniref:BC1881 family protein n=1 Tax=Caloranaerobacter sp. DY30410 TaxID=3238305 RepID=UPI003D06F20E
MDSANKGDKKMFGFGKRLKDYKTSELIKELQSRKNVSILKMNKNQQYQVKNSHKRIKEKGPAVILVIRDV